MDETHQFYVHELQPFISVWSVGQQTDSSQRHSVAEVRRQTDMNNVTLYGSTQLAVDLAELAAEVGDVTLAANDAGSTDCSQSRHTTVESCGERLRASECHEVTADAPIALDGFCLQSSSVSSIRKFTACQPILVVCIMCWIACTRIFHWISRSWTTECWFTIETMKLIFHRIPSPPGKLLIFSWKFL